MHGGFWSTKNRSGDGMKNRVNWSKQRVRTQRAHMARRDAEFKRMWGKKLSSDYYDPQGRHIDMWRWANLSHKRLPDGRERISKWKRIEQTFTREHWVSTVWLGLNHSWMGGPPLIFETMVFCKHDDAEGKQRRNADRMFRMNADTPDITGFGHEYEQHECDIDNDMDRYPTSRHARKGHWRMVEAVRAFEREKRANADMPN
jgi:hypothetical protein